MNEYKIVVLDDDPTGSQTVHSCPLFTRWEPDLLRTGFSDPSPIFFILTNTRALDPSEAADITREVCRNLRLPMAEYGGPVILVSRSDSTLRGHYPVETDVISEELGPFDAHFVVPAFFEGGRITRDGIHYVQMNGKDVPAHETEFAKDSVFGYSTGFLPDYVEEKTKGRIKAEQVVRFSAIHPKGDEDSRLLALKDNKCCILDVETQPQMNSFADLLLEAAGHGKKFLFRSGASILTALAKLGPQPVPAERMSELVSDSRPGFVLVGSHVKKTTLQLTELLKEPGVSALEVDVEKIAQKASDYRKLLSEEIRKIHEAGRTPVVFTSRTEKTFSDAKTRLEFGKSVSLFLMEIVRNLPVTTGFIISKGGITSNDVLSTGLALSMLRIVGQVIPGCTVVRTPADHRLPSVPVVIFPGNVGDEKALALAHRRLTQAASVQTSTSRARPSWDDYFLGIADAVSERATCDRGRSGCVIVREKSILVTGYVGSPAGLPHCDDAGHQLKKVIHEDGHITQHCMRTVHAEQNAICQAARYGISLDGGTLYCRMTPCRTCAMLIINCGIVRVVCERRYHAGEESEEMFKEVGIEIVYKKAGIQAYADQ